MRDEFIQEEISDYSFCPPDRRFDDSPFFLPDFNEKDYRAEKAKESEALGIPVLWIIDNENVTPPWGKVTRINIEK